MNLTEEEKREVQKRAYLIHERNLRKGFSSRPETDWQEALVDFSSAKRWWETPTEKIGAMA